MNKRKMTSIALVAAVAISTVQLAYPADVFAHENISNVSNNEVVNTKLTEDFTENKAQERLNAINENEKFNLNLNKSGSLQSELEKMSGYSKENVKSLTISTSSGAALNEDDFKFMKEELVNLTELNLENADCIDIEGQHRIPKSAMEGHKSITKVVLPTKNVDYISDKAFNGCDLLSSELIIPGNIKNIGFRAFSRSGKGIEVMSGLVLSEGIENIYSQGFFNNRIDGDLNIPSSMKFIGYEAFKVCRFNGSLNFSKNSSLNKIEWNAFYGCDGFRGELKFPDAKDLVLAGGTFALCTGFTGDIIIPENIKSFGSQTFFGCTGFTGNIVIPDSITEISENTFAQCKLNGTLTLGKNIVKLGDLPNGLTGKLVLPDTLKEIGPYVFDNSGLSGDLNLPDGLEKIGERAFFGSKGFTKLNKIPASLKEIGSYAFYGCENLKSDELVFPNSVEKISSNAFDGCKSLTGKLVLPNNLKKIENNVFKGCSGLTGKLVIPNSVTSIGAGAFEVCKNLTGDLIIPDSVTSIGTYAFNGCSSLSGRLYIGESVNSIASYTFMGIKTKILDFSRAKELKEVKEKAFSSVSNVLAYVPNKDVMSLLSKELPKENNTYAVTNDGTFKDSTKFEEGKLATPTREDALFIGWSEHEDLSGNLVTNTTKGKTYYAKWKELNSITLEYDKESKIDFDKGIVVESKDSSVVTVDGNKLKAVGLGETTIEYKKGKETIAIQKVIVTAPKGTVAIVNDKIPYKDLQDAIDSKLSENKTIKVVGDIELTKPLDLSGKKSRTIDFGSDKYTVKPSKDYSYETLIKIEGKDSNGIVIKNAKFETSKEGLDAIKVVGKGEDKENPPSIVVENIMVDNTGNNKGSAIYVENASVEIRGDASVTGNTSNQTVVEIQGKDSLVVLDKDSTINKDKTPEIGNNHSDDVIMGNKTDSNDFDNENIISGGGSIPSIPSKPSKPVYTHKEVIGANRYETAAKVADELGSYDNVVLVNATSTMSDGLAASGLAGKENGAILLTKKDSIPKATMDRIKKVKKVYIIGGENAISQKVSNQITAANIKVERIGGKNRVETSELVAEKLGNYSNAFIVNGFKGEADAMSASAIAARYEAPILLTNGKTSTHAKKSGVEYYVVGGTSVVNKSIADKYNAERLAGKDRYATNREVIDEFYSGSDKLYLANGETLVDALTASTIAKNHGIVLVNKKSDNSVLKDKNTVQIGGMNFNIDFE